MQTEFEFLRRLEHSLTEVARAEFRRNVAPAPARHRGHRRAWAGAAASVIALAAVIGLLAQNNNARMFASGSASFSSVGAAVDASGTQQRAVGNQAEQPVPGIATDEGAVAAPPVTQQQGSGPAPRSDLSKIVRDGQVTVTIDDGTFASRSEDVSQIAVSNRGSILSSSTSGGESGTFTLRIPAANFERAMTQLARLGTVDSSEVHGQDVTAQYVDLKAHMKIYLARRKVLFGLMDQANSIGETLTLQRELDDVQLKIDQIQGQLNFINKQVAESTIKLDMHEPDAAAAPAPGDVENPSLGRAWDHAVQGFLNVLAAVLIGLGYLIPIGVVVAIGYAITRLVRRTRPSAST